MRDWIDRLKPLRSAVRTLLIFGILGSPLGALVLLLLAMTTTGNPAFLAFGWMAILFGYLIGLLPSLLAGGLMSIWGVFAGRPGPVAFLAVGLAVYLVFGTRREILGNEALSMWVVMAVFLVPTFICGIISGAFWSERR